MTRGTAIGLSVALACAALGCRSTGNEPAPVTSTPTVFSPPPASASAASRPTEPPHPLDQLFRGYENELPAPATLSEGNGASLKCPHHGHVTYTLLHATARRLPLERDADVARLVRWYRHADPCIRYIAVEALLRKIVHDRDRLSLPGMHEPDHHQYRDILVSVRLFLDTRRVAHDPMLFDGMIVNVSANDFGPTLFGSWKEAVTRSYNFQHLVEIDAGSVRVTRHKTAPDPKWPDRTTTLTIEGVVVDARQRFVVSTPDGAYTFLPVTDRVVWFDNGEPHDWRKLEKASP